MKVVNVGNEYNIYDNLVRTYDQLPPEVYYLRFAPMRGFYFEKKSDFIIHEDKIYGNHQEKVDKVFNAYNSSERNLGVIASGDKGIGKSLFAKLLCNKAITNEYPVIVIDQAYNGIPDILEKIEQKCVVLLDEFEKVFIDDDVDSDAVTQNSLLSLFDGINNGKKLFVITCNKLNNVSEYIINRPGRFHYHFRFEYPTPDEVETYLEDNIDERFYSEIDSVKKFAALTNINYDCLRAIAFELNLGSPFNEAIKDLNIINYDNDCRYDVTFITEEGEEFSRKNVYLRILSGSSFEKISLDNKNMDYVGEVKFKTENLVYDKSIDGYIVHGSNINWVPDSYDEEYDKYLETLTPKKLVINHSRVRFDFCF